MIPGQVAKYLAFIAFIDIGVVGLKQAQYKYMIRSLIVVMWYELLHISCITKFELMIGYEEGDIFAS